MNLDEIFQKEAEDDAAGARYLTITREETLREATLRRARLVWGCLTLKPDRDFYDEWRPFRRMVTTYKKLWQGEEGYEQAMSRETEHLIYRKTVSSSPWLSLAVKGPDQCGPIYPPAA